MIERVPMKVKILLVSLIMAIFICSAAFGYVFALGEPPADDVASTYAMVFIIAFVSLSALLMVVGYLAVRKANADVRRCVSCGIAITSEAKACPRCRAVQPDSLPADTYLEPKEEETMKKG